MNYFLIIGCVLCGWAMLRVMGDERTQMVNEVERQSSPGGRNGSAGRRRPPPLPAAPPAKQPAATAKGQRLTCHHLMDIR